MGLERAQPGQALHNHFDEGVHFRPIIAKAQTMKSAVSVEMTTYRVRMKCNENNIA